VAGSSKREGETCREEMNSTSHACCTSMAKKGGLLYSHIQRTGRDSNIMARDPVPPAKRLDTAEW
jgi:hypothetical protein